jgi:hypothetical protein
MKLLLGSWGGLPAVYFRVKIAIFRLRRGLPILEKVHNSQKASK